MDGNQSFRSHYQRAGSLTSTTIFKECVDYLLNSGNEVVRAIGHKAHESKEAYSHDSLPDNSAPGMAF